MTVTMWLLTSIMFTVGVMCSSSWLSIMTDMVIGDVHSDTDILTASGWCIYGTICVAEYKAAHALWRVPIACYVTYVMYHDVITYHKPSIP